MNTNLLIAAFALPPESRVDRRVSKKPACYRLVRSFGGYAWNVNVIDQDTHQCYAFASN